MGLGRKVTPAGSAGRVRPPQRAASTPALPPRAATRMRRSSKPRTVLIACSTGGPKALGELLPKLPSPLGAGALVVQHMPPGFTAPLAARLDRASALHVREAQDGDVVGRDDVLVAPGGSHMHLLTGGQVQL